MINILVFALSGVVFSLAGSSVFAQDYQGNPKGGEALYQQHCLRCHGAKGDGNGPEGKYLIIPPADFHSTSNTKMDSELFIIIKFGLIFSPMHGWADRLTDEEILDVISYIRFLAPFKALTSVKGFS